MLSSREGFESRSGGVERQCGKKYMSIAYSPELPEARSTYVTSARLGAITINKAEDTEAFLEGQWWWWWWGGLSSGRLSKAQFCHLCYDSSISSTQEEKLQFMALVDFVSFSGVLVCPLYSWFQINS